MSFPGRGVGRRTQLEIAREFGLSLGAIARAIRSDPSYTKRAYKPRAK